ncbi:hypothetical protein GCM10014719_65670 [Planomonospora parontospora subsp. antibiotica]|nr:hypothetical protein GCM10014719_65670 [Planomonospora parontospora subsp. antibiotica]GII19793.1 hypothetical protein Ppa05_65190 [Planomonospora parontospora subsp. antibiotica]
MTSSLGCCHLATIPLSNPTLVRLAGGFAIGTTTAWRYVREAVDLVAALADDVHTAARKSFRLAYSAGGGTLLPVDRLVDERPYYSGKHHRHGVTVQFPDDPIGRLGGPRPRCPARCSGPGAQLVLCPPCLKGSFAVITCRFIRPGRAPLHRDARLKLMPRDIGKDGWP